MMDFKTYRLLQEMGGSFALGVKSPQSLGVHGASVPPEGDEEEDKMGDEEEGDEEEEPEEGDEEEGDEDGEENDELDHEDDLGNDKKVPPMLPHKHGAFMKKEHCTCDDEEEEGEDEEDEKEKPEFMMKKKCGKKMCKKCNKMKKEDVLIEPEKIEEKQPQPGEVGYAPQGRLGENASELSIMRDLFERTKNLQ